jgi:hypothetical protein
VLFHSKPNHFALKNLRHKHFDQLYRFRLFCRNFVFSPNQLWFLRDSLSFLWFRSILSQSRSPLLHQWWEHFCSPIEINSLCKGHKIFLALDLRLSLFSWNAESQRDRDRKRWSGSWDWVSRLKWKCLLETQQEMHLLVPGQVSTFVNSSVGKWLLYRAPANRKKQTGSLPVIERTVSHFGPGIFPLVHGRKERSKSPILCCLHDQFRRKLISSGLPL